jgi:hypothetical protein
MAEVINPNKKFNHRWKTDPKFIKGFDYDSPEYADVPDDLKWAIPLSKHQDTPEFKAEMKRLEERVDRKIEAEKKSERLKSRKFSVVG